MKVRSSIWYIPTIYGFTSIFLALLSHYLDDFIAHNPYLYDYIPILFLADIDLSLTILGAISTSLLTMTTITFSSIMIVLTTFLSQFSPRTLQNFITDPPTQKVLGIFVSGFIYSIILLLLTRETEVHRLFITPTLAVLYTLVCLAVFVFFIHHVSGWIQVSNLIADITTNSLNVISENFTRKENVHRDAPWEDWEYDEIMDLSPHQIYSKEPGYLQLVNTKEMLKKAKLENVIIRLEIKIGDFVDSDTHILSVWKMEKSHTGDDYLGYLSFGKERTTLQDIEFGITKLVEIALRAVSPALNDPNTAIHCISQLGKILAVLGMQHLPRSFINDDNRSLRIIMEQPDFSAYLYKSFYQIRHYGKQDISIVSSIIEALIYVATRNDDNIKKDVWNFSEYIIEGLKQETLLSLDKKFMSEKLDLLASITGHQKEVGSFLEKYT